MPPQMNKKKIMKASFIKSIPNRIKVEQELKIVTKSIMKFKCNLKIMKFDVAYYGS